MNITLPFVTFIMPYVRCKIVPHFHLIILFSFGVSLKCIHDIFNVTMVFPLVISPSDLCDGRTFTKNLSVTVQVPKSVTQCFNLMINNHENELV